MKKIEQKLKKYLNIVFRFVLEQPQKQSVDSYDRVLIFRPGGIGDMILSVPVMKSIRLRFPNAKIDLLGEPKNIIILEGLEIIDSIYLYEKNFLSIIRLIKKLKKLKYQYVLNLNTYPSFTFGLVTRLLAPKAIRAAGDQREFSFFFNRDMKILQKNEEHMIDHLFSIARDLTSEKKKVIIQPWFDYGTKINELAQSLYNQLISELYIKGDNPKIVLLNLSAGIRRREWPMEKFVEFLNIEIKKYCGLIDGWAILTNPFDEKKQNLLLRK